MTADGDAEHDGLRDLATDSETVAGYYDEWAADYDRTLAQWRYQAPEQVAARLRSECAPDRAILDAGCGTGLSGKALAAAGFETIDGMDVSTQSLEVARALGVYRSLERVDMQDLPLPYGDDAYAGLACVGVLTYVPDSVAILREFARVLEPGGVMLLTQRSDLLVERGFEQTLADLEGEGVVTGVTVSAPMPYLPDNAEFGDDLKVHYIRCAAA